MGGTVIVSVLLLPPILELKEILVVAGFCLGVIQGLGFANLAAVNVLVVGFNEIKKRTQKTALPPSGTTW